MKFSVYVRLIALIDDNNTSRKLENVSKKKIKDENHVRRLIPIIKKAILNSVNYAR